MLKTTSVDAKYLIFFLLRCHNFINNRLPLPDNRNFVLTIHVPGVVLQSLKINEVGARTIYLLC